MKSEFLVIAFLMSMLAVAAVTYPWYQPVLSRNRGFAKLPVLIAVVAIGLAIALYLFVGRPDAVVAPASQSVDLGAMSSQQPAAGTDSSTRAASVASLVGGLEERLAQQPDNGKDWLLLAKSYDHLGRHQEAIDAYKKASELGFVDASLETQIYAKQGPAPEAATISGRLSLSAGAKDQIKSTDTVFIVAKEAGGPPMPLAVIKRSASELPIDFVLSDKQTMVAGRGISSVSKVIVEAKISETGDALNTRPGISAISDDVEPGSAPFLTLLLDVTNSSAIDTE